MTQTRLNAGGIVKKLHAAFCRDVTRNTLLEMAATEIQAVGHPFTSVYMYMLDADGTTLVLEAFAGRETPHNRIPVHQGLCGRAVAEAGDLNVPDVTAIPEYLACNAETQSELIVLIRRHDEILGQIDVDSDIPSGFSDDDHAAVKTVADALAALL